MSDSRTHTPTPDDQAKETPMSDHLARFMDHLASDTYALRTEGHCQSSNWGGAMKREVLARLSSHDGLVEALRDLVALREYGDEADALRADMSGPDGPMIQWAEVEQRVWANARRALAALSGIKTTEGTDD